MHDSGANPGQRIGRDALVAIVTAVITATISSFTTFTVQRRSLEEQKQIEEAKLVSAREAERVKLAADRQKLILDRVEEEKDEDQHLARALKGKYYEVRAANTCTYSPVYLAVRYTDLNGRAMVHGWYTVTPSPVGLTILETQQRDFSFYVDRSYYERILPEKRQLWWGEGSRFLSWTSGQYYHVSPSPFDYIDDNYFGPGWQILPQSVPVQFQPLEINLPSDTGVYTIYFACP